MIYSNDKIDDNSILVFEYFTASGDRTPCIISEAESLIMSLIDDLRDFDIYLAINKSYKYLVENNTNVTPIYLDESIEKWLKENANLFKRSIFIAAENDMNLYNITKILEDNEVKIYNSSSEACFICSEKFDTYEKLFNIVPQPKSFKIKIDHKGYWKRAVENLYKSWQSEDPLTPLKIIIKPISGVDCENIKIIKNIDDLSYDLEKLFPIGSRVIIQEFIEGKDISISLISDGTKAIPLSLNEQIVVLNDDCGKYLGGKAPIDSKLKKKAFNIAIKAVESLKGIKGFVGVDLITNSDITDLNELYLLEVNSRFTTPYVGLQKISNFNIAKSIIDLLDNKISIDDLENKISFNGVSYFKKEGNSLKIEIKNG